MKIALAMKQEVFESEEDWTQAQNLLKALIKKQDES